MRYQTISHPAARTLCTSPSVIVPTVRSAQPGSTVRCPRIRARLAVVGCALRPTPASHRGANRASVPHPAGEGNASGARPCRCDLRKRHRANPPPTYLMVRCRVCLLTDCPLWRASPPAPCHPSSRFRPSNRLLSSLRLANTSANIVETAATLGISGRRWRRTTMRAERDSMTGMHAHAPALGGEECSDTTPSLNDGKDCSWRPPPYYRTSASRRRAERLGGGRSNIPPPSKIRSRAPAATQDARPGAGSGRTREVLAVPASERFVDRSPADVIATFLDERLYLLLGAHDASQPGCREPSSGWIGSTTDGSSSRSGTGLLPRPKRRTIDKASNRCCQRDSRKTVSRIPGAVHSQCGAPEGHGREMCPTTHTH